MIQGDWIVDPDWGRKWLVLLFSAYRGCDRPPRAPLTSLLSVYPLAVGNPERKAPDQKSFSLFLSSLARLVPNNLRDGEELRPKVMMR